MDNKIKPTDRICFNCSHLAWLIGVGQGLRCGNKLNRQEGERPPLVPSRYHTCEHFKSKFAQETPNDGGATP